MAEYKEEIGRLPGEIVEVYRAPRRPGGERDPREIIEVYRPRDRREIVEVYSRPVPVERTERAALSMSVSDRQTASVRQAASARQPAAVRRRQRRGLYKFLICVAVLAGLAVSARIVDHFAFRESGGAGPISYGTEEITIPGWPVDQGASLFLSRELGEALTAQEVYRQVNPAVVTVQCFTGDGASLGTGVIFSRDGYVITNYHVVRGGRRCQVLLDSGYAVEVCYVAGDADSDLAVLKIPPGELLSVGELPAAAFGDSELLVVGDPVYAIGAPRRLRGTLTNGIISAIDRDIQVEGKTMTLLQTNAALNSGNSGGPLINERGQVIGINVAKYMSDRDSVEGLGFAIPSSQLERIVNDLLKWGEVQPEPVLGVSVIPLIDLGEGSQGLLVKSVTPDGAADKAGVLEGDHILTAGGEPLYTAADLLRVRRRLYLGDELELGLRREGEELTVTLLLEEAAE